MHINDITRYQLFSSLTTEEYQALRTDIAKRGVMVPVELDEQGNILDGHNRAAIAGELGLEYPCVVRTFATEADKREHILKLNLLRRHMGPIAWAEAFKHLLELRGVERGQGVRNDLATSATVAEVAEELGVKERTARSRLALAEELADQPDLVAKVDAGEMAVRRAQRVKRERLAQQKTPEPQVPFTQKAAESCVHTGHFHTLTYTAAFW